MTVRPMEVREHLASVVVPFLAALAVGIRYQFANGVTVGLIVAILLAPVWLSHLSRYRGVPILMALGVLAVVSAALITVLDVEHKSSTSLMAQESLALLWMLGITGTLLWVRSCLGSNLMAIAFGLGTAASVLLVGGNPSNLWKYSFSVPVTIIALAAARFWQSRALELLGIALLGLTSVASDSRSFAALLLLTAVTVIWQLRPKSSGRPGGAWTTIAALAVFAFGAYQLLQSLILDGILGEAAQARSQAQLDASGSLVTGGRPELGAAIALISSRWWGFGSGTIPTSSDVLTAKTGMSDLNYDPNNGYVDIYMFGGHFEVHSVLGDLWIRFGIAGAVLAIAAAVYCLFAVARKVADHLASALEVFVVLLLVWNTLFSPLTTSFRFIALAVALLAVPTHRRLPEPAMPDERSAPVRIL